MSDMVAHPARARDYIVTIRGDRGGHPHSPDTEKEHLVRAYDVKDAVEQALIHERRAGTSFLAVIDARPREPRVP